MFIELFVVTVAETVKGLRRLFGFVLLTGVLVSYPVLADAPSAKEIAGRILVGRVLTGNASKAPMTAAEVRAMPDPCIAIEMGYINGVFWGEAMNKNGTLHLLDRPENAMAKGASWYHHYCWGMLSKMRHYSAVNKIKRAQEIRIWHNNMQFIVDWTQKQQINWPYLPWIHKELAEAFLADKNPAKALQSAQKAISLNKEYPDGYIVLSDSYLAVGNRKMALEAASEGLRFAPNSKGLKRRYKELGGVMPFPQPTKSDETSPAVAAMTEKSDATPPLPGNTEPASAELPPSRRDEQVLDKSDSGHAAGTGGVHCRFCP